MGRPAPPAESLTWCVGPPLAVSLPTLLECEDQAEIARAIGFYRERFADVGLFENSVFDGIPEMLASLQAEGTRLFVATSKPRVFAIRILDHFGLSDYFDGIYGSELDGTRDDKGDLIGHLLATERVPDHDAIMVGDRRHDVIGAARHKVPCLGVLYGYGSAEELTEAGAVALCATPAEVQHSIRDKSGPPP
jgi:phosphoglycolate phosphatase